MIATEADLPRIVEMGRRFHEQTLEAAFSADRLKEVVSSLMMHGVVFVTEGGFLAGTIMQNVSDDGLTAHEVLWWSEDGRGQELRERFEAWAKAAGCNAVEFSFPASRQQVGRVLGRYQYAPVTQVIRKEI